MNIILKEKSVYGNILIYPACEISRLFAELIGKKTFSDKDILTIKKLGYLVGISEV